MYKNKDLEFLSSTRVRQNGTLPTVFCIFDSHYNIEKDKLDSEAAHRLAKKNILYKVRHVIINRVVDASRFDYTLYRLDETKVAKINEL